MNIKIATLSELNQENILEKNSQFVTRGTKLAKIVGRVPPDYTSIVKTGRK